MGGWGTRGSRASRRPDGNISDVFRRVALPLRDERHGGRLPAPMPVLRLRRGEPENSPPEFSTLSSQPSGCARNCVNSASSLIPLSAHCRSFRLGLFASATMTGVVRSGSPLRETSISQLSSHHRYFSDEFVLAPVSRLQMSPRDCGRRVRPPRRGAGHHPTCRRIS
jgi:hypothetical protein